MRELIRRNRDEMQDRRRAVAKTDHNPLGTRTYTLAVRDEEENNYDSNDEEAGIPRGGIEDISDEEEGIQRGGIEDSSDKDEGIQRGGIEEEVDQNDCLSENAAVTDDNAAPKVALKKTGGGGGEDSKFIVTADVHVPRVDAAYPNVEMAPAPEKRKLQKNGSKTRKIGKTVSGGKDKAAADTPGVKPTDRAGNTEMDRKMGADRSDEGKGAVDIRVEELSGQAGSSGRSQQTGAGRSNKKKAAPDIPTEELSGQAGSGGRSQKTVAGRVSKKKAAPAYPAKELSCQAEDNGIDPKMGDANEGKEITPTSSVGAVHDGSCLQASMPEEGFSAIKKKSNRKRRVNLAGNAKKKP